MSTTPVKPAPDTPAETVEECFRRLAVAWHPPKRLTIVQTSTHYVDGNCQGA